MAPTPCIKVLTDIGDDEHEHEHEHEPDMKRRVTVLLST